MNDDVKAANEALVESMVRQLRGCISVGDEMTLDHACLIDDAEAWIAGEPARTAAAVAAAREEQREACARKVDGWGPSLSSVSADVRATSLTSTPLGDRIAELEAAIKRDIRAQVGAAAVEAAEALRLRAEKAEAERDALRAQAECLRAAHHFIPLSLREAISRGDVEACRAYAKRTDEFMASLQQDAAALRAQVEAARAGLNVIAAWSEGPYEASGSFDEPCSARYARDTLAAMDGAKP